MLLNKKIVVVMPAYNAALTLQRTLAEIPSDIVDEIVLVDDCSTDKTLEVANELGLKHVIPHEKNRGYGGNQKTCYQYALNLGADIIILLHPDYQYTPKLITAMASVIAYDVYPVVFASRILGNGALHGGMPIYKYYANRFLTFFQNICFSQKLSEYHTGYRAYSKQVLESIEFKKCGDNFIFDNQIIAQLFNKKVLIGELTCPTNYFAEASSINFRRSLIYGIGCVGVSIRYLLHEYRILSYHLLK
ncbi:MAG: glycosyltransferase family 2 protein [Chitinophagaceae bacterium]|nr:glycosyltransferase family 2 protein [Chitinophagaceae bacterium]